MKQVCRHCATPYVSDSETPGFCCSGCEQVYTLIQSEGLGEFYRRQDRAGQPLKNRELPSPDQIAFRDLQSESQANGFPTEVLLPLRGMSCLGCVWLVERVAGDQVGLVELEPSLSSNRIRLRWNRPSFDLSEVAATLLRFGYTLEPKACKASVSSGFGGAYARVWLSLIFTMNGLMLAAFSHFIGSGSLVHLLALVCVCFTLMIGAAPWLGNAFRSLRRAHWHRDMFPAAFLLSVLCGLALATTFGMLEFTLAAFFVSFVVTTLIGLRRLPIWRRL